MKLKSVHIENFRRFTNLKVEIQQETARLIVLVGPNGCGKSSFFDALLAWRTAEALKKNRGWLGFGWDVDYHEKVGTISDGNWQKRVNLDVFDSFPDELGKAVYVRSAYRNDPDFLAQTLSRLGNPYERLPAARMIDNDASVSRNYQGLVSQAIAGLFAPEDGSTTLEHYTEGLLGDIRAALTNLFPDLYLDSLGNPLEDGTFRFTKGTSSGFSFKNLSGGEKSAFDLVLDLAVARRSYDDTLFCIDEPESHMNAKIQAKLLSVLYKLVPENCQLMVATHSIGMIRRARDIEREWPGTVVFLDFGGHEFDQQQVQVIKPVKPNRGFWEQAYDVALDDLTALVAPERVVVCEGQPPATLTGPNHSHDARCYERIFETEFPETKFVSMGSDQQVAGDQWNLEKTLKLVVPSLEVVRLIDRDDRSEDEVAELAAEGIRTLSRRNLECYLFDDEVLQMLAVSVHQADKVNTLFEQKKLILSHRSSDTPTDDLKPASGQIYNACKHVLDIRQGGNNAKAFMRDTLAPLVQPEMEVYKVMKRDIF